MLGTSRYEDGYWNGTEHIYPAQELAEFRRRLLDYLIRTRAFDEARLLLTTIKQEQADIKLALEDEDGYGEDRYEWLPLAVATHQARSPTLR